MAEYAEKCPKLPWMLNYFSTDQGQTPKQQLQAVYDGNRADYLTKLSFQSSPSQNRLTSIMCTLGPKSTKPEDILRLMYSGMNVACLKLYHFTPSESQSVLENIRTADAKYNKSIGTCSPVGICLDLTDPDIRTGTLQDPRIAKLDLYAGDHTFITSDPSYEDHVTKEMIYIDCQDIDAVIGLGDKLTINNSVTLSALEIVGSAIKCLIERAGTICDRAAVVLEATPVRQSNISKSELTYAVDCNVDMLIVPNVHNKGALLDVRQRLAEKGQHYLAIIAKIESTAGVANINEILDAADAIYISRANLERDGKPEKLFIMQKQILACCNKKGKPVIVGGLLGSMMHAGAPTKAEIMDVTNCILDGADCLLLSGETTIGHFGYDAVTTVSALCREAESVVHQRQVFLDLTRENPWPHEPIYALAMSVVEASMKANAACIIVLTTSGRTARELARYRPRCPIIAVTRYGIVARKLNLFRAVHSILLENQPLTNWHRDVQCRIQLAITYGKYLHMIRMGDAIIVVRGSHPGAGHTNSMGIYYASDFDGSTVDDQ